jgi:hypothetical protein
MVVLEASRRVKNQVVGGLRYAGSSESFLRPFGRKLRENVLAADLTAQSCEARYRAVSIEKRS